jgi:hypothetical protein
VFSRVPTEALGVPASRQRTGCDSTRISAKRAPLGTYTITATLNGISAAVSGTVALGSPAPNNFIPFQSVTQQNAIDWWPAVLDVPTLEAGLAATVSAPAPVPDLVAMRPPWES